VNYRLQITQVFCFRAWWLVSKLFYNSVQVIDVFGIIIIAISVSKCLISSKLVMLRILDFYLAHRLY